MHGGKKRKVSEEKVPWWIIGGSRGAKRVCDVTRLKSNRDAYNTKLRHDDDASNTPDVYLALYIRHSRFEHRTTES